jgi:hypothetical protein
VNEGFGAAQSWPLLAQVLASPAPTAKLPVNKK